MTNQSSSFKSRDRPLSRRSPMLVPGCLRLCLRVICVVDPSAAGLQGFHALTALWTNVNRLFLSLCCFFLLSFFTEIFVCVQHKSNSLFDPYIPQLPRQRLVCTACPVIESRGSPEIIHLVRTGNRNQHACDWPRSGVRHSPKGRGLSKGGLMSTILNKPPIAALAFVSVSSRDPYTAQKGYRHPEPVQFPELGLKQETINNSDHLLAASPIAPT